MKRQAMAAQYTVVSAEDMEKFLKRGFRALSPKVHAIRGETVVDLFINEQQTIGVRVWTSIADGGSQGADVGADAIRVQFYNFASGRPMVPGKAPIVKRTQGWRDNLKDRIEDCLELYHEKDDYWESRV